MGILKNKVFRAGFLPETIRDIVGVTYFFEKK